MFIFSFCIFLWTSNFTQFRNCNNHIYMKITNFFISILFLDWCRTIIFTSTQFKARKSFKRERIKRNMNYNYAHESHSKFQKLARNWFSCTNRDERKFRFAKNCVQFGLRVDLCCLLVRFDLSNAHKIHETHAFYMFRIEAQRQNHISATTATVRSCFIAIELEPHHLPWEQRVVCDTKNCHRNQNWTQRIPLICKSDGTNIRSLRFHFERICICVRLIMEMVTGAMVAAAAMLRML